MIISISFLPSGSAFSTIHALRIWRVLHVISLVPRMRHVVAAMIRSLPQIGSILALLIVVSYISAVIVTHLYGADYPELFGTIGRSMLTLLQLMTLEGWAAEVVRPVMETHPYSVFLFIPYMLMTAFVILNLFTAEHIRMELYRGHRWINDEGLTCVEPLKRGVQIINAYV